MSQCEGELFNLRPLFPQFCGEECNEKDYGTAACHTLITDAVRLGLRVTVYLWVCECVCMFFCTRNYVSSLSSGGSSKRTFFFLYQKVFFIFIELP